MFSAPALIDLPPEIWYVILKRFLNAKDLCFLTKGSNRSTRTFLSENSFWVDLYVQDFGPLTLASAPTPLDTANAKQRYIAAYLYQQASTCKRPDIAQIRYGQLHRFIQPYVQKDLGWANFYAAKLLLGGRLQAVNGEQAITLLVKSFKSGVPQAVITLIDICSDEFDEEANLSKVKELIGNEVFDQIALTGEIAFAKGIARAAETMGDWCLINNQYPNLELTACFAKIVNWYELALSDEALSVPQKLIEAKRTAIALDANLNPHQVQRELIQYITSLIIKYQDCKALSLELYWQRYSWALRHNPQDEQAASDRAYLLQAKHENIVYYHANWLEEEKRDEEAKHYFLQNYYAGEHLSMKRLVSLSLKEKDPLQAFSFFEAELKKANPLAGVALYHLFSGLKKPEFCTFDTHPKAAWSLYLALFYENSNTEDMLEYSAKNLFHHCVLALGHHYGVPRKIEINPEKAQQNFKCAAESLCPGTNISVLQQFLETGLELKIVCPEVNALLTQKIAQYQPSLGVVLGNR